MCDRHGDGADFGKVVGQRRSLDGVARVDGQRALCPPFGPHCLDQRGRLGDADLVARRVRVGRVLEVVPVEDVVMQVGRAEHCQGELLLSSGLERRQGLCAGGSGQGGCGGGPADEGGREHGAAGGRRGRIGHRVNSLT
ncbi:hypothetical protein D9M72_370370 [compost metagenome]